MYVLHTQNVLHRPKFFVQKHFCTCKRLLYTYYPQKNGYIARAFELLHQVAFLLWAAVCLPKYSKVSKNSGPPNLGPTPQPSSPLLPILRRHPSAQGLHARVHGNALSHCFLFFPSSPSPAPVPSRALATCLARPPRAVVITPEPLPSPEL